MYRYKEIVVDDFSVRNYVAKNPLEVVVIGTQWYKKLVDELVRDASDYCKNIGSDVKVIRVAGTMELSVAASAAIHNGATCVVVCGVVVRGDTSHFDYVCQSVTQGITTVSVTTNTPIGFGVLMCDTFEQAEERIVTKGSEAAQAALHALCQIAKMPEMIGKNQKRSLGF